GELAQLLVDQRQQLIGGARVAVLQRGEGARDLVHPADLLGDHPVRVGSEAMIVQPPGPQPLAPGRKSPPAPREGPSHPASPGSPGRPGPATRACRPGDPLGRTTLSQHPSAAANNPPPPAPRGAKTVEDRPGVDAAPTADAGGAFVAQAADGRVSFAP